MLLHDRDLVVGQGAGAREEPCRNGHLADLVQQRRRAHITDLDRRQRLLAGHHLRVDIPDELPFVYVAPVLLEQALGQIVDNAAKYSPPGSHITIGARTESDGVVLSVRDEGIGLVGEEQTRLWERFFRGRRRSAMPRQHGWCAAAP